MHSMTGFGRGQARQEGIEVTCEVRTVNHRSLDVRTRLPGELLGIEGALVAQVRKRLSRGRVDIHIAVVHGQTARPRVFLDSQAADGLLNQARAFSQRRGLQQEIGISDLLAAPGILVVENRPENQERIEALAAEAMSAALSGVQKSRAEEGGRLAAVLERGLNDCRGFRGVLAGQTRSSIAAKKERAQKRLDELAQLSSSDPARLAQELALLAEKLDITEELDRLEAHLAHLEKLLSAEVPVGRKLDFLCQELLREANTVASKCADAQMAHVVIDLKAEVEKVREQIQNIE
jgi:uncharacterized protein (TIGR00255 family)